MITVTAGMEDTGEEAQKFAIVASCGIRCASFRSKTLRAKRCGHNAVVVIANDRTTLRSREIRLH
jgi:hypothetical protein